MKAHTRKTLKNFWGQKEIAHLRALRKYSSAPNREELAVYERFFRVATHGVSKPQVLILGATPELRDLALKYQSLVYAVDISKPIILAMSQVMRHRESETNLAIHNDWLSLDKRFPAGFFNLALADASLNNIPVAEHEHLIKIVYTLLQSKGYFITRNLVYLRKKPVRSIREIFADYRMGKNNWFGFILEAGYYSDWTKGIYHPKRKKFSFSRYVQHLRQLVNNPEFVFAQEDQKGIDIVFKYAGKIEHITFAQEELEKMLRKYFKISRRVSLPKYTYTQFAPIYFLKRKK